MDLALQASTVGEESKNASPAVVYSKHIIKLIKESTYPECYDQEQVLFTTLSIAETIKRLESDANPPDAILIDPDSITEEVSNLTEASRRYAVPLILYTSKYDKSVKSLAFSIGADEYFYGAMTQTFFRKLDSIKRLKAYKLGRGNKPYALKPHEVPHVELWSMKRAFDIVVSAVALILLFPVCVLIAIIIKLESRGPILYVSKRAGTGYKIFDFYKFRTMRVGADAELARLAHLNQYGHNTTQGVFFKIKDDPRITRFGQFLRNTSLDEIPQLLNVLLGDMSLVGNRPLPLYEAEKLTKDQIAWRFLAPAGITGLWQITKRGKDNMSPEERIALDMEYAMKNSFWLDMKILLSTFPALIQKERV
jgi:lipopolysaccharide/colanic/teichoic acid biosynthesis glycosyltransferase